MHFGHAQITNFHCMLLKNVQNQDGLKHNIRIVTKTKNQ